MHTVIAMFLTALKALVLTENTFAVYVKTCVSKLEELISWVVKDLMVIEVMVD